MRTNLRSIFFSFLFFDREKESRLDNVLSGELVEVVEGGNADDNDYPKDDIDLGDPALREVLGMLQDVDCIGDGRGEGGEQEMGPQDALNDNADGNDNGLAEDGPNEANEANEANELDPKAGNANDFPVPAASPDPQNDELDFENGMILKVMITV